VIATTQVVWLALAASTASALTASGTRQCVDPCIQAARGAHRDCVSSAAGGFLDDIRGCHEGNLGCVSACREELQECRDATSLGTDLAACRVELVQATTGCRDRFRPGSVRRVICLYRARARASRCRKRAVLGAREAVKRCTSGFVGCARTCGPGTPPGGPDACRAGARSAFGAARAVCRTAFRVTTGGCLGRDIPCVADCVDLRDACDASVRSSLDPAIATCKAERNAGLAECRASNPGNGQALGECENTVRANAFACREEALAAAAPGFGACATSYVACIRACPPA
jgi:hypothetical protein